MKTSPSFSLTLLILLSAFSYCACSNDNSQNCNPALCDKPDNATEMACDADGCFVRSCQSDYRVAPDFQACVLRTNTSNCNPESCSKPAHAKEMSCDDLGCFVKSCEDNFTVNNTQNACILDQNVCIPTECTKPLHASEMACDSNGCFVLTCDKGYVVSSDYKSCTSPSNNDASCSPSNCSKPSHATEMACSTDGCIVIACDDGYAVSSDFKTCNQKNTNTPGDTENCPIDHTKCDKLYENRCCNGREYICNFEDHCEGDFNCKDWIWWSADCSKPNNSDLDNKTITGWCDAGDVNSVGYVNGCVFDIAEDPCTAEKVGHVVYDKRCDSVYNNTTLSTCGKLKSGKYGYAARGYAHSFCSSDDPNLKIQCNPLTNRTEEVSCNGCTQSYDTTNFNASCN